MPPRILVVEDEPAIADAITYALTTDGFQPIWCNTGADALAQAGQHKIDLVILDIGLPDMGGFDLFRQLANITKAPVVFLTARAAEVDRIVGLEMGADDYILKPFSPRELTARVRAVLRRLQRAVPQPASGDLHGHREIPFEVNDERKSISYFGQKLELSRYEYRLLKLLTDRPGKVFTRDELMELAWESPEHSVDRTVDTHIKALRAKLRRIAPQIEAIMTHRGVGYALREDWQV